jgi:Sec-independent protein translocase protein TatA
MNILRLAFELFMLYLLYKLVFDFIIPVVKTTRQVKKQFGDMTAQMQEKMNQQQQQAPNFNTAAKATGKPTGKSDDYIEFEEVK